MQKKYPIHQSPLYKLQSKAKLSELLSYRGEDISSLPAWKRKHAKHLNKLSVRDLKELTRQPLGARFKIREDDGRVIEDPRPLLKLIHRRIKNLICRIETPVYLHSAVKKRSYVTNAHSHLGNRCVGCLDIRKFYPSTSFEQINGFFRRDMECSPDVAYLLTCLIACDGHLPTGSPLSPILSFHVHRRMFEELYQYCMSAQLTFTCYVDDLIVSGDSLTGKQLFEMRKIIFKHGLFAHPNKTKLFVGTRPKTVTGVVLYKDKMNLPNVRHKKVHDLLADMDKTPELIKTNVFLNKLQGAICEARQVDRVAGDRFLFSLNKNIPTILGSN